MKRLLALATTLVLGWLSLNANAQVSTDYDRSVDFTRYQTFAFVKPDVKVGDNPIYNSSLLMGTIEGNLVRELTKRGLHEQPGSPDLLVKVHTFTENKTRNVYTGTAYGPLYPYWGFSRFGYWPFWGGYYGGWNQGYHPENYTQGTLLVDLMDAHSAKLLWRGAVQGVVDNPNRLERQVARGVHKMMKDYPVKAS